MNHQTIMSASETYQCGGRGGVSKRELPEGLGEGEAAEGAEVETLIEELPLLLE